MCVAKRLRCFTLRRWCRRGLSSGTSLERIAPESLTHRHTCSVHRNISRWPLGGRTRSSLADVNKIRFWLAFLKIGVESEVEESQAESWRLRQSIGSSFRSGTALVAPPSFSLPLPACGERVGVRGPLRESELVERPPHPALRADLSPQAGRGNPKNYCVFARWGGIGWVMNWVASSIAAPRGVGTVMR